MNLGRRKEKKRCITMKGARERKSREGGKCREGGKKNDRHGEEGGEKKR